MSCQVQRAPGPCRGSFGRTVCVQRSNEKWKRQRKKKKRKEENISSENVLSVLRARLPREIDRAGCDRRPN